MQKNYHYQFLKQTMRTSTFLFGIIAITTQLLSAATGYGQGNAETVISLDVKNMPIQQVFQAIEEKADVAIMYENTGTLKRIRVTYTAQNEPVGDILDALLAGKKLRWNIRDHVIRIVATPTAAAPGTKASARSAANENEAHLILAYPEVRGRVVDSVGNPLVGASVRVLNAENQHTSLQTKTDREGYFKLRNVPEDATLEISYIGFIKRTVNATAEVGEIILKAIIGDLEEVEVVINTGYYNLPRERATGSFEHVDNSLLNRSVGPDILSRLDGMATGVQFVTPNGTNAADIRVRGLSTIESDETPLIVLDNFPYEGDISTINPNDVESVTVLKDAAAASIWGARAGNGVIVITTKKGRYGQRPRISINSNVTIGARPDLFYSRNRLPSATVMEIERKIFESGGYTTSENTPLPAYVEMLIQRRDGGITDAEFAEREAAMRNTEIRREVMDHLYRNEVSQQYALSASGGAEVYSYHLSMGYDRRQATRIGDGNDRLNLRFLNTFRPTRNLEVAAGIRYTNQRRQRNGLDMNDVSQTSSWLNNQYMPLLDEQGLALPIVKDYRLDYVSTAEQQGLLDWYYRPLDELKLIDRRTSAKELMINAEVGYRLFKGIRMGAQYQYTASNSGGTTYHDPGSYYVRNLVNRFTQDDGTRIIPYGGILEGDDPSEMGSHFLRLQADADRRFNKHEVNGLLGAEARQSVTDLYQGFRLYEFDNDLFIGSNRFDYETRYSTRPSGRARIPGPNATRRQLTDRYLSYFGNAAYNYDGRYTASGSVRWDGSNLFGVKTNQKGKLLWSLGTSWEIGKEDFFDVPVLPQLRLRATYGSSGNVNKGVSHHPVINISQHSVTGLMSAYINSIGNPSLRWEQVNTLNLALDYGFAGRRVSGSFEYYLKNAKDLIGNDFVPPSTGIQGDHKINYANMRTRGMDVRLTTENLTGALSWTTTLLFSYVSNEITHYNTRDVNGVVYYIDEVPPPTVGRSRDAIYALPWYGLDGTTGMPIVYIDGEKTMDYAAYYNSRTPDDLLVAGLTVPPYYGSLRNDFRWRGWSIGAMLAGKAGHSFRRTSIGPGEEFHGLYHMDYFERWQKPGDERITDIPVATALGEEFPLLSSAYGFTEALVESGAHIRLQDVNLSLSLIGRRIHRLPVANIRVYVYARNLGVIWRQNRRGIDPDYANAEFRAPRTFALGIQLGF